MTVLIAQNTPPAVRGLLKRWFIEPRANVFVGTINRRTREKVLSYIKRHALATSWLVLVSDPNCQGFRIERWGEPDRQDINLSGLWLIAEDWVATEDCPY
jgi:CRISPR-associated protein Cas2